MRFALSFLILLAGIQTFAQNLVSIDFSDSSHKSYFTGDTAGFRVVNKELNSSGPSDSKKISMAFQLNSDEKNLEWEFYVRMEFNPTTSNYARFYLLSDQENLSNPLNGYFLKLGGASGNTDAIDLYRQTGNTATKILSGKPGLCGKTINRLRLKITRTKAGNWRILADSLGGTSFLEQGFCTDTLSADFRWAGLSCIYSATRSTKFFFDDIYVRKGPAAFSKTDILSPTSLRLEFTGPLKKKLPSVDCFSNPANPVTEINIDSQFITLKFTKSFSRKNTLTVCELEDLSGHLLPAFSVQFSYVAPVRPGTIFITEVFPDPAPSIGLPEYEFVEILNNSSDTIYSGTLRLKDPSTVGRPADVAVLPGEYAILCSSVAVTEFEKYGKTIPVSPWPSLNNTSDNIYLTDSTGAIADSLLYSASIYSSADKKDGGWTLEMINTGDRCKGIQNWQESIDETGGTPGRTNSVLSKIQDTEGPLVKSAEIISEREIMLTFDESLSGEKLPEVFANEKACTPYLRSASLSVVCPETFEKGRYAVIKILEAADCKGNINKIQETQVFCEDLIRKGELLISEILFNPRPYGADFIELYNNSGKQQNLKNVTIESIKNDGSSEKEKINRNIILAPHAYCVFTEDSAKLIEQYSSAIRQNIFNIENLPTFNDEFGKVKILYDTVVTDSMNYSENMHSPLLSDNEGVSLERISFQFPSASPGTWASAAQPDGFATPGYENSQKVAHSALSDKIEIDPPVFSPDQDGYNDITFIRLKNIGPGFKGTIKIFDLKGRLIKILENNILLPGEYAFEWDGTTQHGERAATGIYLISIKMFDAHGKTEEFKETVSLTCRF